MADIRDRITETSAMDAAEANRFAADVAMLETRLAKMYTPDGIRPWLSAPHPMLSGDTAIERVRAGRTDEVLEIVDGLDSSTFA